MDANLKSFLKIVFLLNLPVILPSIPQNKNLQLTEYFFKLLTLFFNGRGVYPPYLLNKVFIWQVLLYLLTFII